MSDILRPEPLAAREDLIRIDGNAHYREVETWLTQGLPVCITDTYGTALTLYAWLKRTIGRRRPATDYQSNRLFRELLWQLTRSLLVPIAEHRVQLKRAPDIPWLAELYPDQSEFLLPLSDVLGMNGSWQWYTRGVRYSVLDEPLHPFYGVHFTTREEHLQLFDEYLAARDAAPLALDIGCGAGPLSLLLLKHGTARVHASDASPNAVRSLQDELARLELGQRVDVTRAEQVPAGEPVQLIVFNPPWLPGQLNVPVDAGAHYPPDLFPQFFAAAARRLAPRGRLVLLFSNMAELAGLREDNPIAVEVEDGSRFRLVSRAERAVTRPVGKRSPAWMRDLRAGERVELWELAPAAAE